MRRILLTSVAVTALLAGPALAQSPPEPKQSPGASSQQSTPSPKANADREKGQKSSQSQSERRDTTGSSTSGQMPKGKDDNKAADRQEKRGAQNDQGKSQKSDQGKSQENRSNAAQKSGASDSERSQGAQTTQPSGQKGQPKQSQGPKNERSTTGQSSSDQPTKGDRMNRDNANQQGQNRSNQGPSRKEQGQGRTEQGQSRTGTSSTTTGQSDRTSQTQESRSSTSVKPEVQSKFSETIEKRNIKSTTNVNVDVSVGRTIPRSVTVYDVPADIVSINPAFRGKKFTVVRDEIVIIEPSTHKVVSVIPRSGRATTGTSTSVRQSSSRVNLAPEKRRVIRETVLKEQSAPRCEDVQVTVGSQVSSGIRFTPFPELVTREVPEVRSYQYCIKGDDVVLVDPSEHRVVELID